ncbi:putative ribonuclease H-like domain-containing protein [Tanacetum coccineum]
MLLTIPPKTGNPQYTLHDQGIFDSGCSRHMTGNKSFLTDYQEVDGGFFAFAGSPKGGKIIGKDKIGTKKLDFEDTECLVLSLDFKLLDESQVLLKVPRQNNMYSFDLKNVVPSGGSVGLKELKGVYCCKNLQQNRVAERKNRTVIEAARTILADSCVGDLGRVEFFLIPNTNEAVNTALDVSTASTLGQDSSLTYADDVMFSFFVNQSKSPLLDNEDLEQIDSDDLEKMDLKWQVAILTIRIKRFIKKTQRNLNLNGKEAVGLDMTMVECCNFHRKGNFAKDYKALRNQGNKNGDNTRRVVLVETFTNALVVQDGIGYQMGLESLEARIVVHEKNEAFYEESIAFLNYDVQVKNISIKNLKNQLEEALKEKDDLKLKFEKFEESLKNITKLINSQISVKDKTRLGFDSHVNESEVLDNMVDSHECNQVNDRFKKSEGYHAVPPPFTRNFKPARADLSFVGLDDSVYKSKVSETITSVPNVETTVTKTSKESLEKPITVRFSAPIIEDWESDSEDENVCEPKEVKKIVKSSFEKIEFVNARNSTVKKPRKFSQNPRDNKRNKNSFEFTKKACFVCRSFNHLIKDCDFHDKRMVQKLVLNNVKKELVKGKRDFAPTAILTKSGIVPISAARQSSLRAAAPASAARPINTAAPKPFVDSVNTAKGNKVTSDVGEQGINVVKSLACWIWRPKGIVIDHISKDSGSYMPTRFDYADPQGRLNGCSRHMTRNKFYLLDYQDINGGFVAFRGTSKGVKITGKDYEDNVYFVKELKFNLFFVSQMCDKKNNVLFTETECLVLSPYFKLLDESQVLLKIPRHNNMYSFDLKFVVSFKEDLTCLFAKATIDESNLWHRRLGHINFKTMNKLMRGNLVRGLPSMLFENDHTCVVCQKGKQHKTSFITDDFSRFSWIFFLATKDKTPKILKNFITGIENQSDHKGIRREFSVARTLQQNGVAERKNRTLIEAAWTMLADSKLLTTFWAEDTLSIELDLTGCTNANIHEGLGGMKTVLGPQYVLLLFLTSDSQSPKSLEDEVADDAGKKNEVLDPAKEDDKSGQGEATNTNNTSRLNIVSSSFTTMDTGRERAQRNEFESVFGQDKDANGTSIYRMFTPVNVVGSSCYNLGGSLPVNAAGSSCDNLGRSIPINTATLLNADLPIDPLMHMMMKMRIIGDINSATQTRRMTKSAQEHAMVSYIKKQRRTNHKDYQNCLFSYFLSQIEPKKVTQALTDPSWIEAMQDELLQFRLQKVWRLVDLPKGKHAIGTKWVYRNKKDERGIVVRNKERLVAQGYTQEERIDYDKVFAPVARIEAIRLFLAYASFMGFIVYQMDVNSAFLYGTIEEEVYMCQPFGFDDPQFSNKVYKVEKALYGLNQAPRAWYETLSTYLLENGFRRGTIDKTLFIKKDKGDILLVQVYVDDIIFGFTKKSLCTKFESLMHKKFQMSSIGELTFFLGLQVMQRDDGIFISQDKYVADILKKFDFVTVKTTSTPIETKKALLKNEVAEDVDVHLYRSMIGSLMYLTASRPDIMFVVCACARFQVTPKVSHLHAVRSFRYLKGQPIGL